jgi:hypothetical protein
LGAVVGAGRVIYSAMAAFHLDWKGIPMLQFLDDARPYLEALYFLSGPALAVVAAVALRQIWLMKADLKFRAERAAKEKAMEAAAAFAEYRNVSRDMRQLLDEISVAR